MPRTTKPAEVRTLADIDAVIARMTLDQKVGQCMTLAYYGTTINDKTLAFIQKLHCGGLRITPHVTTSGNPDLVRRLAPFNTPSQYAARLNELQQLAAARPLGLPLHMVTDQEGDLSVDILRGGMNFFPSQMGFAATGSTELTRKGARAVARQLRAQGIHMIHSPVLDVNVDPRNPEIGERSFSNSPEICARYGAAFMKGLAEGGVIATGKHFPGRGDSTEDAHDTLPVLRVSRERLNKVDLYPYLELIPRGLPAIMTAHNAYPVLDDSGLPASLSKKIVTGLLRGELGFDGVVTTDAMGMKGMTAICETPEGCARAIAAGNDLVLVKDCTDVPFESFDYIKRWVKQGKISEARLNEAVRRILRMKLAYRIFADRYVTPEIADRAVREPVTRRLADESARRCITVLRDRQRLLPLSPRKKIMVLQPIFMLYQEKCNDIDYAPEQLYLEIQKHARDAVIVEFAVPETPKAIRYAVKRAADFDVVVAFTFTWRAPATSHKMIHALVKAGRKVVVVSNNIYDQQFLPEAKTLVVTHSAMPPSMKAAADVMFGKAKPQGVSPLVEK